MKESELGKLHNRLMELFVLQTGTIIDTGSRELEACGS